jgi:hypothetical protein
MQQNYSQRLEMQIPHGNSNAGLQFMSKHDDEVKKCLKQTYITPSGNFNEINAFISNDKNMGKIILEIPEIVSSELKYDEISIDFMKETDPNEKILEIVIFSKLDEKRLLEKEDIISDKLIDRYPKTAIEYIILVEPYVRQ